MASVSCQCFVVFFFAVGTCGVFASGPGRGTGVVSGGGTFWDCVRGGVVGGGTFCDVASGGVCGTGT